MRLVFITIRVVRVTERERVTRTREKAVLCISNIILKVQRESESEE